MGLTAKQRQYRGTEDIHSLREGIARDERALSQLMCDRDDGRPGLDAQISWLEAKISYARFQLQLALIEAAGLDPQTRLADHNKGGNR